MVHQGNDNPGLLTALVRDGRPLLSLAGLSLIMFGVFALFLSASRQFLPHDVQFLGMTASELCAIGDCRIVHFMFHDRVAFGGALIAIGSLYIWLAEFPLKNGQAWSWWVFVISGSIGFGSFLTYLGFGYLDTWHGAGTLFLLGIFVAGLIKSRRILRPPRALKSIAQPGSSRQGLAFSEVGRYLLLFTAFGMFAGGVTVMFVGMTTVFVPQDLMFIGLTRDQLHAVNDRLIPLIAHDRAGFGGAIAATGITVFLVVWCAQPSKSLWQVLLFSGIVGFACAIGIHPIVGYTNLFHLAPAIVGALTFVVGLFLVYPGHHHI